MTQTIGDREPQQECEQMPKDEYQRDDAIKTHFEEVAPAYYEIVDRLWFSLGYFHKRELECVARNVGTSGLALDAGCGPGRHTELLSDRGIDVVSLDISREMLNQTRERCAERTPHLVQGSVKALPFKSGVFDLAVLMEVLEHLPGYYGDAEKALAEIARVLKRESRAVVEAPLSFHFRIFQLLSKVGIDLFVHHELAKEEERIHKTAPLHTYRPNLWKMERILGKSFDVRHRHFVGAIPSKMIMLAQEYGRSSRVDRLLTSVPLVRAVLSREVIWVVTPKVIR